MPNHVPRSQGREPTPILALWHQVRDTFAELIVPALAGLKTAWLLLVAPRAFLSAHCHATRPVEELGSPLDPPWRALSKEPRRPLEPAQLLLFGILTAALVLNGGSEPESQTEPQFCKGLSTGIEFVRQGWGDAAEKGCEGVQEIVQPLQSLLLDRALIAAIAQLISTLFILVVFAYLFRLFAGRHLSATQSYAFWLYMKGMEFFTGGITSILVLVFGLEETLGGDILTGGIASTLMSFFGLPGTLEGYIRAGVNIYWQVLLPLYLLPRVFPPLTARRGLLANLAGRVLIAVGPVLVYAIPILATLIAQRL